MLNQLQEELKSAMKNSNKAKVIGLRNLIGKLKKAAIDKGKMLNEDESLKILKSTSKQLKESIDQYQKGERQDLANKELFELSIIEKYLPKQLSEQQIRKEVKTIIKSLDLKSTKDFGKIMGVLMNKFSDSADGKLVQSIVKEELN